MIQVAAKGVVAVDIATVMVKHGVQALAHLLLVVKVALAVNSPKFPLFPHPYSRL